MNMTISLLPWSTAALPKPDGGPCHVYLRDGCGRIIGSILDAQDADHVVSLVNRGISVTAIQDLEEQVAKLEDDVVGFEKQIEDLEEKLRQR